MAGFPQLQGFHFFSVRYCLDSAGLGYLLAGVIIVLFPYHHLRGKWQGLNPEIQILARGFVSLIVIMLAVMMLSKTQFNPFIYFQF